MIEIEPSLYYSLFRDLIEDDNNHPVGGYVYIPDANIKELGVLWHISQQTPDPFNGLISSTDLLELDREYFTEHAAEKILRRSVRLEMAYWLNDPAATPDPYTYARTLIGNHMASAAVAKYLDNWLRLFKAFFADYNPIENYNMKESEGETTTGTGKAEGRDMAKIFGANSITGAPSNSSETESSTETSDTMKRNLSRSGNIGVVSSQQMIQSEIDLRKNSFAEMIFEDLDKLFTLSVF